MTDLGAFLHAAAVLVPLAVAVHFSFSLVGVTVNPGEPDGDSGGDVPHVSKPAVLQQPNVIINAPIVIVGNPNMNAQEIQAAVAQVLHGIQPGMPAYIAATTQPVLPARVASSASSHGFSFEDYCLDDTLDTERVYGGVIDANTFRVEQRYLRKLASDGVPMDPPTWDAFMSWVNDHPKKRAGCEVYRKAYARYCGFHGITVPAYAQKRWDHEKAVERGRREGRIVQRERFFRDGPWDVLRLLRAEPYEDPLQNDAFHHAVTLMALAGPRSAEPRDLRVADVRLEKRCITGWWQEKKDVARGTATGGLDIPEPWFWDGPGPTVKWYLERVRPKLAERADGADDRYFLTTEGRGFATSDTWRNILRRGIQRPLGYSIGPHAFRRFCATIRRVYGWSVPEIAEYLDDTEGVIQNNYIDQMFVRRVGIRHKKKDGERPTLPPLWNVPKDLDLDPICSPKGPTERKLEEKTGRVKRPSSAA